MKPARFSILLPLLVATACDGQSDDLVADGGFRCIDTATVISLDDATQLGFAPADILALAAGEHQTPIHWRESYDDGGLHLEMGPETGEGQLTVSVAHDGGEIRFITSEPEEGDALEGAPAECPDRVEIDVTAQLTSSGGALAETLATTLTAETDRLVRMSVELSLSELTGSYQVAASDPDADVDRAHLDVGISEFGVHGSFTGQVELHQGDAVGVGFIEYATFPTASPRCWGSEIPIPVDAAFDGFSGLDALALVNAERTYELSWEGSGAVPLTLTASHDGNEVCVVTSSDWGGDAGMLQLGAVIELATEDGTIAASFPVRVSARPGEGGNLSQVSVWNEAPYGELVSLDQFTSAFGTFPTDLSGYDMAGVDFSGGFAPHDEPGSADGHLVILGATDPGCSPDPGAGCPGYDIVEVARGEWGNK